MEPLNPHLLQALELAESAIRRGDHPFGALLVHRGEVLATAENKVVSERDITAHAELNLVRKVFGLIPPETLVEGTLYASTEPCAMCCGAIYWAGIGRVVFGCSNQTLSRIVGGTLEIPAKKIFRHGYRATKIEGPCDDARFRMIHEAYWGRREREADA